MMVTSLFTVMLYPGALFVVVLRVARNSFQHLYFEGVANGKSETCRDAETAVQKFETET